MALTLKEIRKKNKKNASTNKKGLKKESGLKPWESRDQFEITTRTLGAKEAIEKAQKKRSGSSTIGNEHSQLETNEKVAPKKIVNINFPYKSGGFWGLIKNIFS